MFKTTAESLFDEKSVQIQYDLNPDRCPICHKNCVPKIKTRGTLVRNIDLLELAFQCTNSECENLFIGYYSRTSHPDPQKQDYFKLVKTAPFKPKKQIFPDCIMELSKDFVKIYNQSLNSELLGLDQVAGAGLRKALEFLIKDFAISENPSKKEEIKKKFLGNCIKEYINDQKVKLVAKRAAWLGNDETHYMRIWKDKDIENLKDLIKLTVNWIENILLTKKYEKEMPEE